MSSSVFGIDINGWLSEVVRFGNATNAGNNEVGGVAALRGARSAGIRGGVAGALVADGADRGGGEVLTDGGCCGGCRETVGAGTVRGVELLFVVEFADRLGGGVASGLGFSSATCCRGGDWFDGRVGDCRMTNSAGGRGVEAALRARIDGSKTNPR